MPQPDYSQVHINVPLTNVSVAYQQAATNFIADQVFPRVPVDKQGNLYYEYLLEDWIRSTAQERGPATESAGSGWDLTSHPYFARVFAIHKDIDDQTMQNADAAFNMESDATQWVTRQLLLKRDLDFVSKYLTTGLWGTDYVVGTNITNAWDTVGGTPIEDVAAAKLYIAEQTGYEPNVMVLGATVWTRLLNSPEIVERVKYSGSGFLTRQVIAQALDIENLVVARAVQNTAPKGATPVVSFLFNKSAFLAYAAPAPGLLQPTAGYIFTWTGLLGAGAFGTRIKRFRMEEIESLRVEGSSAYDMHVVGTQLGAFFSNIVS